MHPVRRQISPHAASLRRDMTDVERLVWAKVRGRQLGGFKFRRQAIIGAFVVDFLCAESRLIVEIDGGQRSVERDAARSDWLAAQEYRILRFWNHEVSENNEGVLLAIRVALEERPSPNPLPQAGQGLNQEHA